MTIFNYFFSIYGDCNIYFDVSFDTFQTYQQENQCTFICLSNTRLHISRSCAWTVWHSCFFHWIGYDPTVQ